MNLVIEQTMNSKFPCYRIYDKDTGKEIEKVVSISMSVGVGELPLLVIETHGDFEFHGNCEVDIYKKGQENEQCN